MYRLFIIIVCAAAYFIASECSACDPCALYSVSKLQSHKEGAFSLSVSEQYTNYDRAQNAKENSLRDAELVRSFSTTQLALSYDVNNQVGIQVTAPFIVRRSDEISGYRVSDESETGVGDVSLSGSYTFYEYTGDSWKIGAGLLGGIKFPTGDTGELRKVSEEETIQNLRHHPIGGASGGRALSLGTGSYDYITGGYILTRYDRYLLLSSAQYTIRTEGDFDYEYADDFLWTVSGGAYLFLEHEFTCAGLLSFSGEFKGKDHLEDELVEGSQFSNLYLGPSVVMSFSENLIAEVGIVFRVTGEDPGALVVPETRVRAGLSYRFS